MSGATAGEKRERAVMVVQTMLFLFLIDECVLDSITKIEQPGDEARRRARAEQQVRPTFFGHDALLLQTHLSKHVIYLLGSFAKTN